jgi:DNA-binding GntR family transcriptional regulator
MATADSAKIELDIGVLSARRSLSDDVVARLRTAIVRGTITPGQRLSETALAELFGVSRGPIREAFAQLEREGLVTLERHRGARVTSLSTADIDEIYELRVSLERLAVERACRHATTADFAAMAAVVDVLRDAAARADVVAVVEADVRFHDLISAAPKPARLYAAWSVLRPQIETFLFSRSLDQRNYLDKAGPEHTALLESIRSTARVTSVAMIEDHIHSAYERLTHLSTEGAALTAFEATGS